MGGGVGGGFGGAVAVHQAQPRRQRQQAAKGRRIGTLAAAEENPQALEGLGNQLHVLVEQRRGDKQHRGPGRAQGPAETRRFQQGVVIDHQHPAAIEQGAPDIHGAGVEGRVGGEGHPVLGVEVGIAVVEHQAADGPVRHLHALGHAGGAGGVHDVGHGLGRLRQVRVVPGQWRQLQAVQVDPSGRARKHLVAAAEQQHAGAVLHHEGLALGRGVDIQGHIGRGAFADGQFGSPAGPGTVAAGSPPGRRAAARAPAGAGPTGWPGY